ncbi:MAG: STAS domain-containing protein [Deltaproteobacteria bacterium]|nr:STAS domain-containing protein [Deltaproteobacteria bacterium]
MSTTIPILRLGPVLLISVQVELQDATAEALQQDILEQLEQTDADAVVIDISGLDVVDSFIARVLTDTASMARLLAARCVIVGMKPEVAMVLLEMGLVLPELETALDVRAGLLRLGYALRRVAGEVEGGRA